MWRFLQAIRVLETCCCIPTEERSQLKTPRKLTSLLCETFPLLWFCTNDNVNAGCRILPRSPEKFKICLFERFQPHPTEDEDGDGKPRGGLEITNLGMDGRTEGRIAGPISTFQIHDSSANDQPEHQRLALGRGRGQPPHPSSFHCTDRLDLYSRSLS